MRYTKIGFYFCFAYPDERFDVFIAKGFLAAMPPYDFECRTYSRRCSLHHEFRHDGLAEILPRCSPRKATVGPRTVMIPILFSHIERSSCFAMTGAHEIIFTADIVQSRRINARARCRSHRFSAYFFGDDVMRRSV